MNNLRKHVVNIGHIGMVILITLFSVFISIGITAFVMSFWVTGFNLMGLFIAVLAPLVIAPISSWYLVELLIKVHHLEEGMRTLATYDVLTGAMTRRAFQTNFETLYRLAKRNKSSLSFIFIDMDDFKKINDRYGHAAGDEVLKSFSLVVKECTRNSDLLGRVGGEEFALVLPDTNLEGAIKVSNDIRCWVNQEPVLYGDEVIRYTVSFGVAVFDKDNDVEVETLYRHSDKALYQAKKLGKNCVAHYGPTLKHKNTGDKEKLKAAG